MEFSKQPAINDGLSVCPSRAAQPKRTRCRSALHLPRRDSDCFLVGFDAAADRPHIGVALSCEVEEEEITAAIGRHTSLGSFAFVHWRDSDPTDRFTHTRAILRTGTGGEFISHSALMFIVL